MTRRPARTSAAGQTVIEVLVAIVIGLVLVGGAMQLFVNHLASNRRMLVAARTQQDLQLAIDLVARELRRSGYVDIDATGTEPQWRLSSGALQVKRGAAAWQSLTDADTMRLTRLEIQGMPSAMAFGHLCKPACPPADSSCPTISVRSFNVSVDGYAVSDPAATRHMETTVLTRNETVSGACP